LPGAPGDDSTVTPADTGGTPSDTGALPRDTAHHATPPPRNR
jgi:hypothetical protein